MTTQFGFVPPKTGIKEVAHGFNRLRRRGGNGFRPSFTRWHMAICHDVSVLVVIREFQGEFDSLNFDYMCGYFHRIKRTRARACIRGR